MTLYVELLYTVPGIDKISASCILAEIGNNLSRFPDEHHFASWGGHSPGNNESAGKKNGRAAHGDKWLKPLILECSWGISRTKNTYLRSKYDSLVGRRGKKKALIAVGHKIIIAAYFILKNKEAYQELGGDYLDKRTRDKQIKRYLQKLREFWGDVEGAA